MRNDRLIREEMERRLRLGCIADRVVFLFGGDRLGAQQWLHTPNHGFGDKSPVDFAVTELDAERVEDIINRIEHWLVPWHPSEAQALADDERYGRADG